MQRLVQTLLFLCVCQAAVACLKPSMGKGKPPSPAEDPKQPDDKVAGGTSLTFGDWQKIEIRIEIDPERGPRGKVIGFDKVAEVLGKEAYGPCSLCHTHEWPYISSENGWPRFLESLSRVSHGITTKESLAALLVDCVDQTSEEHCAGDPQDTSDNMDFKMPSKFGFEPVTENDLTVLKQWLVDGTQELSIDAHQGWTLDQLVSIELVGIPSKTIDILTGSPFLLHDGGSVKVGFEIRFSGVCADSSLTLRLKDANAVVVATASLQLRCRNSIFVTDESIKI